MDSTTEVGKNNTSLPEGGVFFQTLHGLLKQREALDHQILQHQGRLLKALEEKVALPGDPKKYVERMPNTTILRDAIRESMIPGQKMTMQEILEALQNNDLYHTRSGYFYTMVNNKLNRDPKVRKVSRGVFVLRKTGQRKMTA